MENEEVGTHVCILHERFNTLKRCTASDEGKYSVAILLNGQQAVYRCTDTPTSVIPNMWTTPSVLFKMSICWKTKQREP